MTFLLVAALLLSGLGSYSPANTSQRTQENPELGTCEEIATDLAKYKLPFTTWGQTVAGDPHYGTQSQSGDGESFWIGTTMYKSKSRLKKTLKQIHDAGFTSTTPIINDKGQQGERVLREMQLNGKVTTVFIWRITDRMIEVISAPSLKLALKVEKANYFCREELERRQRNH